MTQATTDVENSQAGFFFLYLCEMDGFLHMHCNDAEKIAGKLAWYEQNFERLFEAALRRDPEAKFFLFSDHGMTPVRRHYDLAADIDACAIAHAPGLPRGVRFDHGPLLVFLRPRRARPSPIVCGACPAAGFCRKMSCGNWACSSPTTATAKRFC